jgi:hypothetical protein
MRRITPISLLLLLALGASSCFPTLPDRLLVDNLRVLAVNVDPPTANLMDWPTPVITVTALTVEPGNEELEGLTHRWRFDLPEGEEWDAMQELLPEEPHGPQITIELAKLFEQPEARGESGDGAREDAVEWIQGVLPLNYLVESEDDHRETVKLVTFLMPDLSPGDDDDSAGDDDDDSAATDDDDDDAAPPTLEDLTNLMPAFVSISVGETTWTADELPGPDAPLYIGPIDGAGAIIDVGVDDDDPLDELGVSLYRTAGCDNLPPEEYELGSDAEGTGFGGGRGGIFQSDDPCGDDNYRTPRGNDDDPDWSVQGRTWRPLDGETSADVRLWIVLHDQHGAQTWQELRPQDAP